ncbi:MAG: hypothetical protein NVS9B14_06490 [Candidatus Acidiferrum sp.]
MCSACGGDYENPGEVEDGMNATEFYRLCESHGACREGLEWITGKSLAEFWQTCERADWMLWLCGKMEGTKGWPTRQQIVLVACTFAESALEHFEKKYPEDKRPRKAIEAARAWAQGTGTIEDVKAHRAAAYDAAYAAYAAAAAAAYAYDAAAYAAAYAAWRAVRGKKLKEFADVVRRELAIPFEVAA